jgi:hydroxyethylthiazole kinase-like uncharacterized protein yjeF
MSNEILTPLQMSELDRLAIARGPFDEDALLQRAGNAVAATILSRFAECRSVSILCGPGNNGGDGYVAARVLTEAGVPVDLFANERPRDGSAAARAAQTWAGKVRPLSEFTVHDDVLVVDALYGAGLSRPLSHEILSLIDAVNSSNALVLAVDLPSGLSGETGKMLGGAFKASVTVTFVRKKPAHLLLPGRSMCGDVVVADIGIDDALVAEMEPSCSENSPHLWLSAFPSLAIDLHKYSRGHVAVRSGNSAATGAARLSAGAATRAGAGAVTLLSPEHALAENAAHLTSIMLHKADSLAELREFFERRKPAVLVFGPGLEPDKATSDLALRLLDASSNPKHLVFDAGALSALGQHAKERWRSKEDGPSLVLTPHEGEFRRLFPDIAQNNALSKLEMTRNAAVRSNAVVIFKGPDTVIAAPDGRAAINTNGTPLLATAGSGDVLSGIVAGLLAQSMPSFEACCAAVWMHAEAARRFGPGLVADDLADALLPVLRELFSERDAQTTRR